METNEDICNSPLCAFTLTNRALYFHHENPSSLVYKMLENSTKLQIPTAQSDVFKCEETVLKKRIRGHKLKLTEKGCDGILNAKFVAAFLLEI